MKKRNVISIAVLGAVLMAGVAQAGTFLDNFNRANTSATNAAGIGSAWFAIDGAQTSETNDWSIWDGRLQLQGGSEFEWSPANIIYNTNAITTAGDFTLTMEMIPNNFDVFGNAWGAMWQMADHDGGGVVDDGYGIRFGSSTYQVVRLSDGGFDMQVAAGSVVPALEQGVSYTFTVVATGNTSWDISLKRTDDGTTRMSISADNTPTYEDWGDVDGGYAGVMYNANVWNSSVDDFSVTSPDAIQPPSAYELWKDDYGISGEAPTDDHDLDGLLNVYEYGLGGDPTNAADQGISPTYSFEETGGTNWLVYVYPRLLVPVGVNYYLELTENLAVPAWTNDGYFAGGIGWFNGEFHAVTNNIPTDPATKFVRLVIEEE